MLPPTILGPKSRQVKRKSGPPSIYGMGSVEGTRQEIAPLSNTSKINTASPYTGSQLRQYSTVKPTAVNYGMGSGDRTRQAYGQAMANRQSSQYMQAMEDASRQQQQKAEQSRSADIFAQRADQVRRYGLDEGYRADRRGIELQKDEDMRNIRSRLLEASRNRDLEMRNATLNAIMGGGMMSSAGNAWIAGRQGQPFFGGGLMGGAAAGAAGGGGLGGGMSGMLAMGLLG